MRCLGQRRVEFVLEHVMQVAERLLLRDHHHVVARRVRDELADIVAAHGAEWRGDERMRLELERVLEVGREGVELVRGDGADLTLLELECRHRTAGEIVLHAAPAHRGPVADDGGLQGGLFALSGEELFQRLETVERPRLARRDQVRATAVRDQHVALGLHRRIESQVATRQQILRSGAAYLVPLDMPPARHRAELRANAALAHRVDEVAGGGAVLWIAALVDRDHATKADRIVGVEHLPRRRDHTQALCRATRTRQFAPIHDDHGILSAHGARGRKQERQRRQPDADGE